MDATHFRQRTVGNDPRDGLLHGIGPLFRVPLGMSLHNEHRPIIFGVLRYDLPHFELAGFGQHLSFEIEVQIRQCASEPSLNSGSGTDLSYPGTPKKKPLVGFNWSLDNPTAPTIPEINEFELKPSPGIRS